MLKRIYEILKELWVIHMKELHYTKEMDQRSLDLVLELVVIFLKSISKLLFWVIIGHFSYYFTAIFYYCYCIDDFSIETIVKILKHVYLNIDPIEEQRRIAQEALREKHKQAEELIRKQEEEWKKKKPPDS